MNKIVLTNAGIAELINAEQTGTAPVALVQVGLGTGKYDASATQTALSAEFKRLSTISGGDAGDNVIHLFVTDASSDAYTAFEVGIYTDSGTLLGVVSSRTEPIVQKAAGSTALLAIDFVLTNADPDSITVGDTTFVLPPATTEMQGIVELATPAEVVAGTDNYRAITPYALAQRTATAIRKGLMRFATVAESETGTNTDSAVTPAGLMAVAAKYLPLAGGTMTGQIKSNIGDILARNVDGGWLRINGSTTDANGANLTLWGKSATEAGQFCLMARNTASYSLVGTSAGVLTWSGPVVTASDDSTKIATTAYVKDCLPKSVGSATKLTYTNSNGVLTASTSTVGSASKPVYLNGGTLTECSSSLTDYLPLAGGYMDNGAIIYLTENTFSLDNTYTSAKEATGLVFRLKQTKDDNTTATYKGGILVLHVNTLSNTHNYEAGWRIGNPRSGNNPSAGTDDGVDIGTGNCWDKLGLRYFFDINKAYAYTSRNPPLRGASTKYYKTDHLVTHGNLEHFLTRDGNENYPLGATIPSTVGDIVKRTADTSWARINGGTSFSDGANLLLYGINSSSNAGLFQLQARASASTSWQLKGDNTGLLSWNGSILNTGGVIVNQKNHFRIKDTDYAYNEVPSADSHYSFARVDKNNANVGRLQISRYKTSGNQQVHLVVNSPVDGSEKVFLRGIQDSSGNHWVEISETRTTGTSDKEPVTVGYLNSRLGSYLPLAGGTMTGTIVSSINDLIKRNNDTNVVRINGGSAYENGASLSVFGKSNASNAGIFTLRANNGTNSCNLNGTPAGSLTWGGSDVYVEDRTNVSTVGPAITRSGTANWLRFTGGEADYTDGASLILYGKTHSTSAGCFNLSAFDGTNRYGLSGNASTGVLTWNGSVYLQNDGVYGTDLTGKTIDLNDCYSSISGAVKLFHCNTDGGAENISNLPEQHSFLLVSYTPRRLSASDYVIHQHFYCLGAHYSRRCTSGTWTSWILDIGASSASLGDANTPLYLSNGVLTSTGKSFANYLPLSGGTMTGNIHKKYAALTKGTNPSGTTWHTDFITLDNGGTATANRLFELRGAVDSNGYNFLNLMAYDFTSGSSDSNALTVGKLLNGVKRTDINNAVIRIEDHKIMRNATNGWMRLTGGSTDNSGGGSLLLYGKEASSHEGQVILQSHNGTNYTNLILNPTSQAILSTGLKVAGGNNAISNTGLTVSGTNTNYGVKLQSTGFTKGTTNSTTYRGTVEFYGNTMSKWQDRAGLLEFSVVSNKSTAQLVAYNVTAAENTSTCAIGATVDASGNAATFAPTPAAGDNSTKIATTAWVTTAVTKGANMPPGTIVEFAGTSAPSGWLYCNGAAVSRTTYAALFSAIGTGYGTGNGSSTFNLPDFRNRVPQGGSSATDRGNIAAGLPNITGKSHAGKGGSGFDYETEGGAFRLESSASSNSGEGNKWQGSIENFDASRCSSIYGNSTTVQPPAVKVMFIIKT